MGNTVDAVIEALKIALEEARKATDEDYWEAENANRWINRLPGAWMGRWKDLKLKGYTVDRQAFVGHVRATLAYLETNKDAIRSIRTWSWGTPCADPARTQEPIDAEFKEVTNRPPKQGKSIRVLK
jgi:hypothetical protein